MISPGDLIILINSLQVLLEQTAGYNIVVALDKSTIWSISKIQLLAFSVHKWTPYLS